MKIRYLFIVIVISLLAACGAESTQNENVNPEEQETAVSFRNLDIQVEDTSFVLTGEVKAEDDFFYFEINQGDKELLGEQAVDLSAEEADWVSFEIMEDIPEEAHQAEEAPIITMYGKTSDGEIITPNYIPIDIGVK